MKRLPARILLPVGGLLLLNVVVTGWLIWRQLDHDVASGLADYAAGLNKTIVAGLKESMRRDDQDHLRSSLRNLGASSWVRRIRVVDKEGHVVFSSEPSDVGTQVSSAAETCRGCHRTEPAPMSRMAMMGANVLEASDTIQVEKECASCHERAVGVALGVLVTDLDMTPLAKNARRRALNNIALLAAASLLLILALVAVLRVLLQGRLRRVSDALYALRREERVAPYSEPAVDELDELGETVSALAADLECQRLSADVVRTVDRELNAVDATVLLLDASGRVLLSNDAARRELKADHVPLSDLMYPDLDRDREALWQEVVGSERKAALWPLERERRDPEGARRFLMTLSSPEHETLGYLEVGRSVPREEGFGAPVSPPVGRIVRSPYHAASANADTFFRGLVLLSRLANDSLERGALLELDPMLGHGRRAFGALLKIRTVLDEQVRVSDIGRLAASIAGDFMRLHGDRLKWHVFVPKGTSVVGNPLFLRELVTLLLELASDGAKNGVVVFLRPAGRGPRLFLGAMAMGETELSPDARSWLIVTEIVARLGGGAEFTPSYDALQLEKAYPNRLARNARGPLFLVELG